MPSRKRRYKSLSQPADGGDDDTDLASAPWPPVKRRRLSLSNLSQYEHQMQTGATKHAPAYLSNNLIKLRNDDKISDVTFVLKERIDDVHSHSHNTSASTSSLSDGDDELESHHTRVRTRRFKCIKAFFAAHSPVFRSLLFGDFKEGSQANPEISIEDISISAFEFMRDLFYHLNPRLTSDIVLDVAIAAHRYLIEPLLSECINFLRRVSNLCQWYALIHEIQRKYQHHFCVELYLRALIDENYMFNNCAAILFGHSQLRNLYALKLAMFARLIRSSHCYLREERIWHKCVGYALHQCTQQYPQFMRGSGSGGDSGSGGSGPGVQLFPAEIGDVIETHLQVPKQILVDVRQHAHHLASLCQHRDGPQHLRARNHNGARLAQTQPQPQTRVVPSTTHSHSSPGPRLAYIRGDQMKALEKMVIRDRDLFVHLRQAEAADAKASSDAQQTQTQAIGLDDNREPDEEKGVCATQLEEDDKHFVQHFRAIMTQLAPHVRFVRMFPAFFVKVVQSANILSTQQVIDMQNYFICRVVPAAPQRSLLVKSRDRKKRALRYFTKIQRKPLRVLSSPPQPQNSSHLSESEEQKRDTQTHNSNSNHSRSSGDDADDDDDRGDDDDDGESHVESLETTASPSLARAPFNINDMAGGFERIPLEDLCVFDFVDHRDNVGRFAAAVVDDIDCEQNRVHIKYVGWQSKWDIWCSVTPVYNRARFCRAGEVSTRAIHRAEFKHLSEKELKQTAVQCRLAKYWYKNHPDVDQTTSEHWRDAVIKRVDRESGQCQLVIKIANKQYLWWTHLDFEDEVKCKIPPAATSAAPPNNEVLPHNQNVN